MEKRTKESRKRINSLILLIAFTAIMLIVSTYAWFTSQKDITLSNLRGTVEVAENMEISLDAKTWHQEIDLSDQAVLTTAQATRNAAVDASGTKLTELASGAVTNLAPILPVELLPVSGIGETGSTTMPLYTGTATSTKLTGVSKCVEPNDKGYFAFDIYIKNTSKDGLDDVLQLNLNSAVQVLPLTITKNITENGNTISREYKGDATSGLQNTVRVGLALYGSTVSSTATQAEIISGTWNANVSDVAIWEPNAKDHVEYIVENNNKLVNGAQSHTTFSNGSEVDTYALDADAVGNSLSNVYDVGSSYVSKQGTFKTDKGGPEKAAAVATDYRVRPTTWDASNDPLPLDIKNTSGADFKIASNKVSRLRVYLWLEGQDVDCINIASQGGGIELDLGLTKDNEVGEVLNVTTP